MTQPKTPSAASAQDSSEQRAKAEPGRQRLPPWFRIALPGGERYGELKASLRRFRLATVCEEARCPNQGECWSAGTATLMILGSVCTRGCRFCAVKTGNPKGEIDPDEPMHAAEAAALMAERAGISYIVITSVDRDDIDDLGASHYARCIEAIKGRLPSMKVEVLTPDFQGRREAIRAVTLASPDVFGHNIETVRRLHRRVRDARAGYDQSLSVLKMAREEGATVTKSGFMVGHGESRDEIREAMRDLRAAGVDILTIGQYLQPTARHLAVERQYTPEEFEMLREEGEEMGFSRVFSGPLVRSSYRAKETLESIAPQGADRAAHAESGGGRKES